MIKIDFDFWLGLWQFIEIFESTCNTHCDDCEARNKIDCSVTVGEYESRLLDRLIDIFHPHSEIVSHQKYIRKSNFQGLVNKVRLIFHFVNKFRCIHVFSRLTVTQDHDVIYDCCDLSTGRIWTEEISSSDWSWHADTEH